MKTQAQAMPQDNKNGPETHSAKNRLEAVHPATIKEQNMQHRNTALAIIDSLPAVDLSPTVSRTDRVAGLIITRYADPEYGCMIAIDTDETVHVEHLPELASYLLSIHKDHRLTEARSYFATEGAIDPATMGVCEMLEFATNNGFDAGAFFEVAAQVIKR